MSSIGAGYDLSAGTLSPQGKIFQIEYACKAVESSGTAIAIRGKDGVVFAVENIVTSRLFEPRSSHRIFQIDLHIGMNVAGLLADAKHLVETARNECTDYRANYNAPIPLKILTQRLATYMHAYTLTGAVRPFGVCVMLSSYNDHDGPELYMIEPSGLYYGYFGCAIGKAKQGAQTEIEKIKFSEITCKDLVNEAAKIIYLVHDEIKDKNFELALSWVGKDTNGRHEIVPKEVFEKAEEYAKKALEEDEDSDEA